MSPTLLSALVICCALWVCYGAIDTGVRVFGTTVAPNFVRAESPRELPKLDRWQNYRLMKAEPLARIPCPTTHPHPCERGAKCASNECCNGLELLDVYSACCSSSIPCHRNPEIRCKANPTAQQCPGKFRPSIISLVLVVGINYVS